MLAARIDAKDGIVEYFPTRKKVAIVGAGWGRGQAPYEDPEWVVYALNEIAQVRFDAHWEMHPRAVQNDREMEWLAQCKTPCYVLDLAEWDGWIPGAVEYPLERVLDVTKGRRYFTSTFSFQTALAIADGFEEIGLWGVELALGSTRERLVENPCLEYWLGLAEGRGVKVTIPEGGTLLRREYLYGYQYHEELSTIQRVCDEAVLTTPRDRWPKLLQRMGAHFGGKTEAALAKAAAELGRSD